MNTTFDHELFYNLTLGPTQRVGHFNDITKKINIVIAVFGVIGQSGNVGIMFSTRSMSTPSFVYLKALAISELIFNVNTLITYGVMSQALPIRNTGPSYSNPFYAYYTYVASRVISSISGYMILYMTLMITFERYVALQFAHHYRRINRRIFALRLTLISLLVSDVLNSWHAYFEHNVLWQRIPDNRTVSYLWTGRRRAEPASFVSLTRAKDAYNAVVRIAYPFLLIIFVVGASRGFVQFVRNSTFLQKNNRKIKREYTLVYFMIATVILAIIQVIPREIDRITDLIFPDLDSRYAKTTDMLLKMHYFDQIIFDSYLQLTGNMASIFGRSMSFYLNLLLNKTFRRACLDRCKPIRTGVLRVDSAYATTHM